MLRVCVDGVHRLKTTVLRVCVDGVHRLKTTVLRVCVDGVHRLKTTVYRRVLCHSAPPTSPLISPASALICSSDPLGGRLAPSRTPLPRGTPSGKCGVKHLWPPRVAAHRSPLTGRPPGKRSSGAEGRAGGSLPCPSTTESGPGPPNGQLTAPPHGQLTATHCRPRHTAS